MKKTFKFDHRVSRQRGVISIIVTLAMIALLGFAALAIDMGYLYSRHRQLQASTDAAALAGVKDINCCTTSKAANTATLYSSVAGGYNTISGITVTMPTAPQLKCLNSMKSMFPCTGIDQANVITVTQTAVVPLFFAPILGIPSSTITATSTASGGGMATPLNVMLVLDTTASMNQTDSACGTNMTKIDCALKGVQTLLTLLSNSADIVGLMVFPPLSNSSQASKEYDCNSSTQPVIASSYSASGSTSQVLGLSSGYLNSNNALNTSSNLVKAVSNPKAGGTSNCTGLSAVGGIGTYFAGAITAAQAAFPHNGNQNVIIVLSDGDANSTKMGSLPATQQCKAAVTAAQQATQAGTWVYSFAYNAANSGCSTDTNPKTTPCATMRNLASKPSMFYSDNNSSCGSGSGNMADIFSQAGYSLMSARLVPNNAQ